MLAKRAKIEYNKLRSTHPEVRPLDNKFVSQFNPGSGKIRKISVVPGRRYPRVAPKAFVHPHQDLVGSEHVDKEGEICYMRRRRWNPGVHNLAYAFSRCKRIIHEILQKQGLRRGRWSRYS